MFEQIVVPLDGSELAERALPCAERVATATGGTLHLVRVVVPLPTTWADTGVGMYGGPLASDEVLMVDTRAVTAYLDAVRARVAAQGGAVRVAQPTGDAASALLDYERDASIDLVVMCSHGRGGLARFAVGSVAERLLRHGGAPVLLVRAFGQPVALAHAVVPLDGSALAEEALRVVAPLAPALVREVTLLRVIHAPEEGPEAERYLEEVAHRLQREGVVRNGEGACRRRVVQGDPAQAIINAAGTDTLVVMATHGRAGVMRWALGSVADRVARGGAAAVLLVRAAATPDVVRM